MPRRMNKESFIAMKELLHGLNDSKKIIKDFKPDIVIGTGGYVCGPVVYMAKKKNIPALIHEQNAFPGITNKILSRYVDKVAVTFDQAKKYFKYPDRVINTGNPVRKEIIEIDKEASYKSLDMDKNIPFILSFGGSGGQRRLNDMIYYLIKKAEKKKDIQIIHVTGKRFYDEFINKLEKDDIKLNSRIKVLPYLYQIPEALSIASVVITSAGAITLAEISAMGVPSILIPKAYTAENHQEFNARAFEEKGASIVVLEKDLVDEEFKDMVYNLVSDKGKLLEMRERSKEIGRTDASEKIVEQIQILLGR